MNVIVSRRSERRKKRSSEHNVQNFPFSFMNKVENLLLFCFLNCIQVDYECLKRNCKWISIINHERNFKLRKRKKTKWRKKTTRNGEGKQANYWKLMLSHFREGFHNDSAIKICLCHYCGMKKGKIIRALNRKFYFCFRLRAANAGKF